MRKIAEGARRIVEARRHSQLLLLDSLARVGDWITYTNFATSLVLKYYDKAPWGWAAIAYGMRQSGHASEASRVARLGMELCPSAPETMLEACRDLCLESNYKLAKKYRDQIVQESGILGEALEVDPDFEGFRYWLEQECSGFE